MDILLISPAAAPEHGEAEVREGLFPPLGLMIVAALTPAAHSVTIRDEHVTPITPDDFAPDLVGLTATTANAERAYDLADAFRVRGIPVVMGGMHASALPEEALKHVDAVVIGEAEELWPRIVEDFARGTLQQVYRHTHWPDASLIPVPRRELVNPRPYLAKATLQATRGCPHACTFCTVSKFFGGTYRVRPVDQVVAEARSLTARPLVLVDDNLFGNVRYARQLFAQLAAVGTTFVGQASTTLLRTPTLIAEAAQAGCRGLLIGFESLGAQQLDDIRKRFNVAERYTELIERLHDVGIAVVGSFMFGLDGDATDVFARTVDFAEVAKIDIAQFSIVTPLPGTALFRSLQQQGRILVNDWRRYDGSHCTFSPRQLAPEDLETGLQWAYERFYSWRCIQRRLVGRFTPLLALVNRAYHQRVRTWLRKMTLGTGTLPAAYDV